MTAATAYDYDVVLLSDLRYPGGNSASIAEEIKAQRRAGYSTALVDMRAPHMVRQRAVNRKLARCLADGLAELVPADRPLRTRALIVRQPRLFTHDPAVRTRIEADVTILVANQPPVDGLNPPEKPYYDPAEVHARACKLFGDVLWAPIGPLVRESLQTSAARLPLRSEDWVNVIDVDEWRVDRSLFRHDRPVIGRHSRGHLSKWPASAEELLAAYPSDPRVRVEVLGGAEPARATLGAIPENWTVHPFGSMSPRRFLSRIDFFVYFHHKDWVEAFGRNIIEAMASGSPAILPRHFEPLFGDGAEYATPTNVLGLVEQLYADQGLYRERGEAGREIVAERFGATTHAARIAELIGSPSGSARSRLARPARRVLLAAPEPVGAAATLRLLRVAAALPDDAEPTLITAFPALHLAADAGVLCEHLSVGGEATAERIAGAARRHEADVIVIAAREREALPAESFADVAEVVWLHSGVTHTWPSLTRDEARAAFGGAPDARMVLLAPGADERRVTIPRVRLVIQVLLDAGWTVVLPEPLLTDESMELPTAVVRPRLRPLAAHLAGFDAAVASPGDTITAELTAAGIPSLLVPMRAERREGDRAIETAARGVALGVIDLDEERLVATVAQLADDETRNALVAACATVPLDNELARVLATIAARPL